MKALLTSALGGSIKVDGKRIPQPFSNKNDFMNNLQELWPDNAKVLFICGSPDDFQRNDEVFYCVREAFLLSGLKYISFEICDDRTLDIIDKVNEFNVIIIAGGHVPTQNKFMKALKLKERLAEFDGLVLAWSAGSMNCAEMVYAGPELEGEAIDPDYVKWMPGLGITKKNIFPHFSDLRDDYLDGLRVIEDITVPDSIGHCFYALNNGSYILNINGVEALYGEAWAIKDGIIEQICGDDTFVLLQ